MKLIFCLQTNTKFFCKMIASLWVCGCVFKYSSTMKVSSVCKMPETYLRGTDQRCYAVSIIPGASAKFLHLDMWKCHISPPKTKLQLVYKLERNNVIYSGREKIIYIDMGYKSASTLSQQVTKRYWRHGGYSNLNSSTFNQVLGNSMEKIYFFLSNIVASIRWALLVDALGETSW